jgi:hypothetical protein
MTLDTLIEALETLRDRYEQGGARDAKVQFQVPGGGDYSNMNLNVQQVRFVATSGDKPWVILTD